jgi:RNA polymerase sigma-70 factor (ECF subfamily)
MIIDMPSIHNHPDAEEFDLANLYEHYGARIRAFITRITSDREAAEDLCHDTFLKALAGWHRRRQAGSTIAWLYQIARNTAYDHLRRRQGIVMTALQRLDDEVSDDQIARLHPDLPQAFAQLNPRTRQALLLFYAGYRTQEIAAMAGTTDSAIKHLIVRGRARLRARAA